MIHDTFKKSLESKGIKVDDTDGLRLSSGEYTSQQINTMASDTLKELGIFLEGGVTINGSDTTDHVFFYTQRTS